LLAVTIRWRQVLPSGELRPAMCIAKMQSTFTRLAVWRSNTF